MRILVSGAGIAGLTFAYWMLRGPGADIVLVERSTALPTGAYGVDVFGAGSILPV